MALIREGFAPLPSHLIIYVVLKCYQANAKYFCTLKFNRSILMYWEGRTCYCSYLALTFRMMSLRFSNRYTMNPVTTELGWIVSMTWSGSQLQTIQFNGLIHWKKNLRACRIQCHGTQCTILHWLIRQPLGSLGRCGTSGTSLFLWCLTLKERWLAQMHSTWCGFGEAMPSLSPAWERNLCGGKRHGGWSFWLMALTQWFLIG